MSWFFRLRKRRHLEEDLEEELAFHHEMRASEADSDAPPFGNQTLISERIRDEWRLPWIDDTVRDTLYALRGFRKHPGFPLTAISSLALGIAAVIAIFTAADDLLFRPLPYPDPGRLLMVWESNRQYPKDVHNVISPANYLDWKSRSHAFEDIAAFVDNRTVLFADDRAEQLRIQSVTSNLFGMLGAQPIRGRLFSADEDRASSHSDSVLLISYRLWQNRFAGDANIIGRRVMINSLPRTIIGVMPSGFYFRDREVDLWAPLGLDPAIDYRAKQGRYMRALGRLRPGVTMQQAQSEMTAIASGLEHEYPIFDLNWTVTLESLRDSLVGDTRTLLLVLLAAVGLLMAVATCNVASLLLARYASRRGEMAVRIAIGAGRARLIRQLLTESLILALIAGGLGVFLGRYALAFLVTLAPRSITETANIVIDWRIVAFATCLSGLTGILFGLAPSLAASKVELSAELSRASRGGLSHGTTLRACLTIGEIAVSIILLAGAGLLFRTLIQLQHVDPGLNPHHLMTFRFNLPAARYKSTSGRTAVFAHAMERIQNIPGVSAVSATSYLPFGMAAGTGVVLEDKPTPPGKQQFTTVFTVMPRYFATMGIPLHRGREFTAADNTSESPLRFIVNEAFVRTYYPNENPLGKAIEVDMDRTNPFGEIIGVVGDIPELTLSDPSSPTVYYVHAHLSYPGMVLLVRTQNDPLTVVGPVRRVMHELDPAVPVADVRSMETILGATYGRQRFGAILLGGFSLSATLLAAIGIYGLLAYSVSERTREIGVRLAIGAHPRRIVTMVLGNAARLVFAGLAIGMVGALGVSKSISGMLFETSARDPVSFAIAPALLVVVAIAAAWLPAHRASTLDPVQALRVE
ncbi:MAG TPA: ABC transporter permease [Bryobacteraceae bacterium]|jgi:putative ABC transport system permease protein